MADDSTFTWDESDRDRWSETTAALLVTAASKTRAKMAARVTNTLTPAIYSPDDWLAELDGPVTTGYTAIAAEAAAAFSDGVGLGMTDKAIAVVAATVAAAYVATMGGRADIVQARVDELVTEGTDKGWTGDQFSAELGLDGGSGPLSDELMGAYGAAASNGIIHYAADYLINQEDVEVDRTWNAVFVNTRPDHAEADQQVAAAGEPFDIGGEEAYFPQDPNLSDEQSCNCQCFLTYAVAVADNTGSGDSGDVSSDPMPDDTALAASGSWQVAAFESTPVVQPRVSRETFVTRTWGPNRFYGRKATSRLMPNLIRSFADGTVALPPTTADGTEDGVCVTVEPTPAEKQLLAVPGGEPVAQLHVTLAYIGKTGDVDDTARLAISTVLANIAAVTPPFEGDVAGIGYFGTADSITLALIDSTGLAAFRTTIVDALCAAGIDCATDHGFLPHITLAYSNVDAADKVGTPIHFNELRCRYGGEVLAFDLVGDLNIPPATEPATPEPAPAVEAPVPETPPAAAASNLSNGIHFSPSPVTLDSTNHWTGWQVDSPLTLSSPIAFPAGTTIQEAARQMVALATTTADDSTIMPEMDTAPEGEPPAELSTVPDDILASELANRLAERVIAQTQADGTEVTADQAASIHGDAEAAVNAALEEAMSEVGEELAEQAGDVSDDEPGMDGADDGPVEPVMYNATAGIRSGAAPSADGPEQGQTWHMTMRDVYLFDHTESFAVSAKADLPLADRDTAWDGSAAEKAMAKRASSDGSGDTDTVDFGKLGAGYLWHADNPSTLGEFKFPIADVISGELKAVPKGIFAAAQRLDSSDIPADAKTAIKARVTGFYQRMAKQFNDPTIKAPFDAETGPKVVAYTGRPFAFDGYPAPPETEPDGEGIVCVEGIPSDDGRMFAEGALDWRQLPLPMTFINRITSQHGDAKFCGWWTNFERRGQAIWGQFVLAENDAAAELRDYMADKRGSGRFGVSADVGGVNIVYSTPDGQVLGPQEAQEAYWSGEEITEMMVKGSFLGATGCIHPAFADAQIWLIDTAQVDPADETALVATGGSRTVWRTFRSDSIVPYGASDGAALVAAAAGPDPEAPHSSVFDLKPGKAPPFTVYPDNTFYGLVARKGDCHIGYQDRCVKVPMSGDFSHFYATGTNAWRDMYTGPILSRFYSDGKYVLTSDEKMVEIGPIILNNVHPNLARQASDTQPFYAHTGSAIGDARLYVTDEGIVAAGCCRPDTDAFDVRRFRASGISPDWRWINGELKILALLAVNVSGFQVEGIAASAGQFKPWCSIDETTGEVMALVAAGGVTPPAVALEQQVAALRREVARLTSIVASGVPLWDRQRAADALDILDVDAHTARQNAKAAAALARLGLAEPLSVPTTSGDARAALKILALEPSCTCGH